MAQRTCKKCGKSYDTQKSSADLKASYCSKGCENAAKNAKKKK
jgi:hypothetical protein